MGSMKNYYVTIIGILFVSINIVGVVANIFPRIFDSIYQFGDSDTDTGNLIRIPGVGQAFPVAYLPYGISIGRPTGRWSDGLLIPDYVALALGLPLLNPYLDTNASFQNGVNFAFSASTALDNAFLEAQGLPSVNFAPPLQAQVNLFRQYLQASNICSNPTECSIRLSKSVVVVGPFGVVDIILLITVGKSLPEIRTYVPFITQAIVNGTRDLIESGATRIVVPGSFALGCFPIFLTLVSNSGATPQEFDQFGCSRSYNDLATYQNTHLQNALNSLRLQHPNVRIVYADYYGAFISLLVNAPILGFDRGGLLRACCGAAGGPYNFGSVLNCGPGVPVCPNPKSYIHWDGIHLTQEAYRRITEVLMPKILLKLL